VLARVHAYQPGSKIGSEPDHDAQALRRARAVVEVDENRLEHHVAFGERPIVGLGVCNLDLIYPVARRLALSEVHAPAIVIDEWSAAKRERGERGARRTFYRDAVSKFGAY
jgi:hypothetical protein